MRHQTFGIEPALDALLVEAFNAYRQGLLKQPQLRTPLPHRDFNVLKFQGTIGWLPVKDRLKLRNLHIACGQGLVAARQGRFADSLGHYEQAKEHLDLLEKGARLAWLLGTSTYQAGVAYLDFRQGCIGRARERLDHAMDADLELERLGLPVMQIHRIQQGHNLARMDFRLGRREAAIQLTGMLLAYMERRIDGLSFHRNWRSRSLQAIPRSLMQAMIHQIIGETAGFLVTGNAPKEEWRSLIEASQLCQEPEAAVLPQVQYALRAQYDCIIDNKEGYLLNLERFFRFGIRRCHLLWYALMVELVNFCRKVGTHRSLQVRDIILRDSAKWKSLPPPLRDCLDGPAEQRTVA